MALVIGREALDRLLDHAEALWPEEACALLIGRHRPRHCCKVTRIAFSENIAADKCQSFEIDPSLRIRLEMELQEGEDAIIGLFHSHPDGAPVPSATDAREVREPEMIWLIAGISNGKTVDTRAFLPNAEPGFDPIPLTIIND